MDLAVWLGLRLDEDEKTAAGLRSMVTSLNEMNDRLPLDSRRGTQVYDAGLWALTRVLAEIAAKRKLLALHMTSQVELVDGSRIPFCGDRSADPDFNGDLWAPCLTARLLAAPYADYPGYDQAWSVG